MTFFSFFPKDENLGVLKSIVCMRVWVGGRCGSGCGGGMGWEAGGWVGGGDLGGVRPAAIHHQARTQYTFRTSLAKRGENSRFAKAMRSEGDESGIAYWKRKGRVIFKEEMKSSARAG